MWVKILHVVQPNGGRSHWALLTRQKLLDIEARSYWAVYTLGKICFTIGPNCQIFSCIVEKCMWDVAGVLNVFNIYTYRRSHRSWFIYISSELSKDWQFSTVHYSKDLYATKNRDVTYIHVAKRPTGADVGLGGTCVAPERREWYRAKEWCWERENNVQ